ncbi:MAG: hydroxymethylbilane synthase [Actinomycetota bacterium]
MARLRVGTRGSKLALTQTAIAIDALRAAAERRGVDIEAEVVTIRTRGDAVTDRPFEAIGPKGVFAAEVQRALLDDRVDVAVHSAKDLPAVEPARLVLAAVLAREDPRDVLVSRDGKGLGELPEGAVVGTSSSRREALIRIVRPDLRTAPLRGNVDTRLEKVASGEVDAAVLAAAGIVRLGRQDAITERLDPLHFVPPPGQGALAIEAEESRFGSDLSWVGDAEDGPTRACIDTERAFMQLVEGGCEVPLGAWARHEGAELVCDVLVAAADGSAAIRDSMRGTDPRALGADLARAVLAKGAARLRQSPG